MSIRKLVLPALIAVFLLSCSSMQDLLQTQKPRLSVKETRLSDMSFESVTLTVDIQIDNPNSYGINMAGFDYDFSVSGKTFLQGDQNRSMNVPPQGKTTLPIPVRINFIELYNMIRSLKDQDNAPYRIACGLTFDIPVLGPSRIPVSHSGSIPAVKLPAVDVAGIKTNDISITGAALELRLKINNPNGFGLSLKNIDYDFSVDGNRWVQGRQPKAMSIARKTTGTVTIPISLNFLEMGSTVYNLISGDNELNYRLSGAVDLGTTLPVLKDARIPIEEAGKITVD